MEELMIDGIDLDVSQGRITLLGIQDQPGVAATIFAEIGRAGIVVDMIVQSHLSSGEGAISFTVPTDQVDASIETLAALKQQEAVREISSSAEVAKLSVSGIGLRSHTGVAIRMFNALADVGINVQMISTSEVRVNVIVNRDQAEQASDTLQAAFADVIR
jgi:aspartate kinase